MKLHNYFTITNADKEVKAYNTVYKNLFKYALLTGLDPFGYLKITYNDDTFDIISATAVKKHFPSQGASHIYFKATIQAVKPIKAAGFCYQHITVGDVSRAEFDQQISGEVIINALVYLSCPHLAGDGDNLFMRYMLNYYNPVKFEAAYCYRSYSGEFAALQKETVSVTKNNGFIISAPARLPQAADATHFCLYIDGKLSFAYEGALTQEKTLSISNNAAVDLGHSVIDFYDLQVTANPNNYYAVYDYGDTLADKKPLNITGDLITERYKTSENGNFIAVYSGRGIKIFSARGDYLYEISDNIAGAEIIDFSINENKELAVICGSKIIFQSGGNCKIYSAPVMLPKKVFLSADNIVIYGGTNQNTAVVCSAGENLLEILHSFEYAAGAKFDYSPVFDTIAVAEGNMIKFYKGATLLGQYNCQTQVEDVRAGKSCALAKCASKIKLFDAINNTIREFLADGQADISYYGNFILEKRQDGTGKVYKTDNNFTEVAALPSGEYRFLHEDFLAKENNQIYSRSWRCDKKIIDSAYPLSGSVKIVTKKLENRSYKINI